MDFKVGVGKSDFRDMREAGNYYVDKTEMLYELVHDTDNAVSLFTRPRRFGKTLMMSMMENFFSVRKDSREIFDGLSIMGHNDFCEKWMNKYPVLFVSFKDAEADNFEDAYGMLKTQLSEVCKNIADIMENKVINDADRQIFRRLMENDASTSEVKFSLKTLMRMLNAVYGKRVILLIDEYDVPLAKASEKDTSENGYYGKMLNVIKGIMSTALKDNEFLQFAVITGCLRIAKESIFTGTNKFASYSVLDDGFSKYFGFLDEEVDAMLETAGRQDRKDIIKQWYNGYTFGRSYLYCPWDVINYLSELRKDEILLPKNYWKNTSHNGILLTFVKRTDFDVSDKFETLLNGGTVSATITDQLTYDTLHSSEDNLWSVLLMTGYITKADKSESGNAVFLKIPNKEISSIFEDTVVKFFEETADTETITSLINAFWQSDEARATKLISDLLWNTISYNDYHEDYYHAFLAGIFVGRGYSVESNKEKGLGRPDIYLKDKKNRRAIIIEAKKSGSEADLDKDCDEAIKQIIDKKYAEGLYGYEQIFCYGVAFFQKQAKVRKMNI
ncbi:AAA family ATPase [Butyrivibrio sp. AE3004]|uniref:AAA family ATPase n=1 Tax=Butyrivibrio sp. AE3004 TaxID=1506994 RepID=UPI00049435AC|nr:AAA family ATPase [Butyrivibrio sp. AE3004]